MKDTTPIQETEKIVDKCDHLKGICKCCGEPECAFFNIPHTHPALPKKMIDFLKKNNLPITNVL